MLSLFSFQRVMPAVLIGFCLELLLGDPEWLYRPARLIRALVYYLEYGLRSIFPDKPLWNRIAGGILAVAVVAVSTAVPWLLLSVFYRVWYWLGLALETFWCWQLFSLHNLRAESTRVYAAVRHEDLDQARRALGVILGRDTLGMDIPSVIRCTIEAAAKNISDGLAGPLIAMFFSGAVGGFFFRSICILDDLVGYRDADYRYFGTVSARLDDLAGLIPARVAAFLIIVSAEIGGYDAANAWKIFVRDRKKHTSPNAAQTMSAMAGALDIQLGGNVRIGGVMKMRQKVGDPLRQASARQIMDANRLMYISAVAAMIMFVAVRVLIYLAMQAGTGI